MFEENKEFMNTKPVYRKVVDATISNQIKAEVGDIFAESLENIGFGLQDSGYSLTGPEDRRSNNDNSYFVEMMNNSRMSVKAQIGSSKMIYDSYSAIESDDELTAYGYIETPVYVLPSGTMINTDAGASIDDVDLDFIDSGERQRFFIKMSTSSDINYNSEQRLEILDYLKNEIKESINDADEQIEFNWIVENGIKTRLSAVLMTD